MQYSQDVFTERKKLKSLLFLFQADYNVVCYNDQMRLKTAVELLNATKDIEKQVEKVGFLVLLYFHDSFIYLCYLNNAMSAFAVTRTNT